MKTMILFLAIAAISTVACTKTATIPVVKQNVNTQSTVNWVDSTTTAGSYFTIKHVGIPSAIVQGNTASNQSGSFTLADSSRIEIVVGALKPTQVKVLANGVVIYQNFGYSLRAIFTTTKTNNYNIIFSE